MELLSGTTLRDELRRKTRFGTEETLRVMRHVCAAVEAAHRRQLIHRDLKPENIFLAQSEAGDVTKVLDFGIAKVLASETQRLPHDGTGAGVLLGTLAYMAPEQLRGEDVSPASDLWALAVIAHEMLTGTHPFATHGLAAPTPRGSDIGVSADRFFARALSVDPSERPVSAASFLEGLTHAVATSLL
jgi:serine/threonine-protein kinase